jgi:glycosyltransferase involved in cell wall biosynthesis
MIKVEETRVDEKKKLLIINQHFSTGGIKKSLENLLPSLMNRYDVNVVFISGNTQEFDEKFPEIRMKSPFILSSALSSLKEIRKMNYSWLRDIIKVAFVFASKLCDTETMVNLIIRISKSLGEYDCVISYAHDNWLINGGFYGGGNSLAIKKTKSMKKITWVHGEPKAFGLNKDRLISTYSDFDYVVAVSDAVKSQFEQMSEGRIKCERIYNILNLEEICDKCKNVSYKEDKDIFRIVTVGRLSKIAKRIDKVNEIAKMLKKHGYKFQWTVVGGGSEYESCVRVCKEYGLENMVNYVGNQNNPYPYMKESDLFVLVSDTESMSIAINESIAVGTPVITTDFPAAYESIQDGVTGFIVGKSIDALYQKVAYCINNREVLNKMRKNIQMHPYSNNNSIKKIESLIG